MTKLQHLIAKTQSYGAQEIARIVNQGLVLHWPKGNATPQDWIACHIGIKTLCAVIGGLYLLRQTPHDQVLRELLEDLEFLAGIVAIRRTATRAHAQRNEPIGPHGLAGTEPQRLRQAALL